MDYKITRIFFLMLLPGFAFGQSDILVRLQSDVQDERLDEFSPIEAAFILSGVTHEDSIGYYVDWYNQLLAKIKDFRFDTFDQIGTARKIFNYLRTTLYDDYVEESTTLLDIVERRQYNCVSSTILYNMICQDMGMSTAAFETPTHVYTIFMDFGRNLIVENTHPMGFDILSNLHVYSQYLADFYPENQAYQIGLDRLYAYEHRRGRQINNTELLGLLSYNRAYFAMREGAYAKAYDMILLAQDFNSDSRSNANLETKLYYTWGGKCFDEKRYYEAFQVLADGTYRYPNEAGLKQNTRAAFFNALRSNWHAHQWRQTSQLIGEMYELQILNEKDFRELGALLTGWLRRFRRVGDEKHTLEVEHRIRLVLGDEKLTAIRSSL